VREKNSVLNPDEDRIKLGPNILDQQLPVEKNKKGKLVMKQDYLIFFAFEVHAIIEQGTEDLIEGQDKAATWSECDKDGNQKEISVSGSQRIESDRKHYIYGSKAAPFKEAWLSEGIPDVFVGDDYSEHPSQGKFYINTDQGVKYIPKINKKGIVGGEVVWLDQPRWELKKGNYIGNGLFWRAYFRAWLIPDLGACQKYFTIEFKVDTTGKVTANTFTERTP
jgi:hypothetical protein